MQFTSNTKPNLITIVSCNQGNHSVFFFCSEVLPYHYIVPQTTWKGHACLLVDSMPAFTVKCMGIWILFLTQFVTIKPMTGGKCCFEFACSIPSSSWIISFNTYCCMPTMLHCKNTWVTLTTFYRLSQLHWCDQGMLYTACTESAYSYIFATSTCLHFSVPLVFMVPKFHFFTQ